MIKKFLPSPVGIVFVIPASACSWRPDRLEDEIKVDDGQVSEPTESSVRSIESERSGYGLLSR